MSIYVNQQIIAGRLGNNPDIRYFQDGTPTCSFNIAVKKTWKDQNGEPQEKTTWLPVKFTGAIVENFIEPHIGMGDNVLIFGELDTYMSKQTDGTSRKVVFIAGKKIQPVAKATPKNSETHQEQEDDGVEFPFS